MTSEAVPVTVLGGYLGAGKTTLVNAMLREPHGLRIALLINDFGAVNIDAALVDTRSATRIDLTNGCACCQIGADLGDAFFDLVESEPPFDRIVVEASGVADPGQVASWAGLPGLRLDGVIVAVDPSTIAELLTDDLIGPTVGRQLAAADLVVITKSDDADVVTVDQAQAIVLDVCGEVPIVRSGLAAVPLDALFDLSNMSAELLGIYERSGRDGESDLMGEADGHIASVWWPSGAVDLDDLCGRLTKVPGLVRAKGFVKTHDDVWLIQLVGRRIQTQRWPSDPHGPEPLPVVVGIGHSARFDPNSFARILGVNRSASAGRTSQQQ